MRRFLFLALLSYWLALPVSAQEVDVSAGLLANISEKTLANIPPSAATITVTPEVAEDRHPIIAELSTQIPDGAKVYGNGWVCSDGVRTLPVSATVQHVWADPGDHTISYTGVWVHTKTVTVVDKDGNEQTIESLLGIGMIDTTAVFTVEGEQSPDPTPDPPGPLAKMWVIVVEESKDRTPQQAQILLDPVLRKWLTENGHRFRLADQDQPSADLRPWIEEVPGVVAQEGSALPYLFLVDNEGEAVWEGPLPETRDDMRALCKEWGAEK